jgi:lipopolysaccharide transport system permease protein
MISFVVLLGLMLYYKITPTWMIFTVPLFALLAILTTLAVSLWLSALNVQYRDVQYMIPFLIQAWMYASPVAYSAGLIPTGRWRIIYGLNPLAGVIQGFRWALLGGTPPDELMIISVVMVLLLLVTGLFYFRRMERTFADVV